MYRKILVSEKWIWYKKDLLKPIASAFLASILMHLVIPADIQNKFKFTFILIASMVTFLSSMLAANEVRLLVKKYTLALINKSGIRSLR